MVRLALAKSPTADASSSKLSLGSTKTSLDTPSSQALPSLSALEVREILVKVPEKDRKGATFGKEKRNSSKNSYHFVSLWVEVACGKHA
jgi:hypothetical protein